MREIKFRLRFENKIVGYEKWYGGEGDKAKPCWLYSKDGKYWNPEYIPHSHKDQYTGLKDKNGKEIYEGDIIRLVYIHDEGGGWKSNSNEIGKVYFDTKWGVKFDCVDFTQRTAEYWKLKKSTFQDARNVEIIGNIYENPELLKEEKR